MPKITPSISFVDIPALSIAFLADSIPISARIEVLFGSSGLVFGFILFGSRQLALSNKYLVLIPEAFSMNSELECDIASMDPADIASEFATLKLSTKAL